MRGLVLLLLLACVVAGLWAMLGPWGQDVSPALRPIVHRWVQA